MKPIPLFGSGVNSYSSVVSSARRLNCFYDVRTDEDKKKLIVRGTPGASVFHDLSGFGEIRGWCIVDQLLFCVAGNTLFELEVTGSGFFVVSTGLLTSTGRVYMQSNSVQVAITDGARLYCYTRVAGSYFQAALNASGSFGVVTDPNAPGTITSLAFIDGRIVAGELSGSVGRLSRVAYISENYDVTHWTNVYSLPTFMTKESNSDALLAVDVLNGTIILWGERSIEYWQDVGSSPNPFAKITGATQSYGLAVAASRVQVNNTMMFLGRDPGGGVKVFTLNGYVPTPVSTPDIEDLILTFEPYGDPEQNPYNDVTALSYSTGGHLLYQLNFPMAGRSLLYDVTTGIWGEVQTGLGLLAGHIAQFGIAFYQHRFFADGVTGRVYNFDEASTTDAGAPIKRQLVSRHIYQDGNDFGIAELFVDFETGVGVQFGQGANPQVALEVSKDGGRTWGIERWTSIAPVGNYRYPRAVWRRLGMARDFVFRFTLTDPVKFVITGGSAVVVGQEGSNG